MSVLNSPKNPLIFRAFWISELCTCIRIEAGWSHSMAMFPNRCDILEWQQDERHSHKARFWRQKKRKGGGGFPGSGRAAGLEVEAGSWGSCRGAPGGEGGLGDWHQRGLGAEARCKLSQSAGPKPLSTFLTQKLYMSVIRPQRSPLSLLRLWEGGKKGGGLRSSGCGRSSTSLLIWWRPRAVGPVLLPVPVSSVVCCQAVAGLATVKAGSGARPSESESKRPWIWQVIC